ncbi:hypothetical protein QU481_02150 [Crenobacter sp. SG2303]|uniref:Uncharacterized protein n=1 Tax=Crenobacter oryzisoli TaxID=3056844 RepID=A0ABT7XIT0_9NEIS|nr:hypothetical protein [Crenobacter sp. SG2303]MDN0073695.1 hypothetical protein [Crenobacter sp. SG2303]
MKLFTHRVGAAGLSFITDTSSPCGQGKNGKYLLYRVQEGKT